MKIVLFSFPNLAHGGGFEKYIMSLSKELSNKGHDVSIVSINRRLQYKLEFLLSCFYLKPRLQFPHKFRLSQKAIKQGIGKGHLYEVSSLREMRKYINRADIVYSKNEILDLFVLGILKNKNTPIICGLHTPLFYPSVNSIHSKLHNCIYSRKLYEKLLSTCSGIHAITSDQISFVREHQPALNVKFFCIRYWTEFPDRVRKAHRESKFRILFLGRLTEQKGVDTLAKIIGKLSEKPEFQNFEFKIGGSGVLNYIAVRLSRKYNNVKYYGFIKRGQVSDLYLNSDICIVPSRWEVFPYVCLEAQTYGLPVVASSISGPKDIIINHKTGILVAPTNIDGFVNAVLKFYHLRKNNPKEFELIKKRARRNISDKCSRRVVIPKLERMFEEIVARDRKVVY